MLLALEGSRCRLLTRTELPKMLRIDVLEEHTNLKDTFISCQQVSDPSVFADGKTGLFESIVCLSKITWFFLFYRAVQIGCELIIVC